MTTFIEKHKHCTIHWLVLEHNTRHRRHPLDTFSEVDRIVHQHNLGLGGNLDHDPLPIPHNDVNTLSISGVWLNTLNFTPVAVSTSAIGKIVVDGADISNLEKVIPLEPLSLDRLLLSTTRQRSIFVARDTWVTPYWSAARTARSHNSSGIASRKYRFSFRHFLTAAASSSNVSTDILFVPFSVSLPN